MLCGGDDVPLTFSSVLDVMYLAWLTARTAKLTGKPRSAKNLVFKKACYHFEYGVEGLGMCLPTDLGGRGMGASVPAHLCACIPEEVLVIALVYIPGPEHLKAKSSAKQWKW